MLRFVKYAQRGDRLATQSGCKRRRLKPIPLLITHTQPFGRRLAFCSMSNDKGRTITLNVPTMFTELGHGARTDLSARR